MLTMAAVVPEAPARGMPVSALFTEGRAKVTLVLWVINFMNLIDLYFLSNWLPTLIRDAGYPTDTSVLVATALAFRRPSPVAAWLLVPYVAWVAFATALNAGIVVLN